MAENCIYKDSSTIEKVLKTKRKYERKKHICPVCNKSITHLPRHLKQKHHWSKEKALDAMSVFDLRARAKKFPCPMKECKKSATDLRYHLQIAHNISSEQIESITAGQNNTCSKRKREYKRVVCPYPGCNKVVRRIHHHLTAGKHKLSRKDPRYRHYLQNASSFVELKDTADEPITVSSLSETSDLESSEDYTDERVRIEMECDEKNAEDLSLSSLSSEKEEEMLKKLRKKTSDKAKDIMRYGALAKHKKGLMREEKEMFFEEEEGSSDSKLSDGNTQSIFSEPAEIPRRKFRSLPGEQPTATLWDCAAAGQISSSEKTKSCSDIMGVDPKVTVRETEFPARKVTKASRRWVVDDDFDSCELTDEEEYKPSSESDEDDEDDIDESDDIMEELKELGVCRNSVTESMLDSFSKWLQGIDGGRRDTRTAKQYVSQISAIINHIDSAERKVSSILNKQILRDKWLADMEKVKRPGTCKSYLGSLSRFLRFVIVEKPRSLETYIEEASKVRDQVQEWMCSYRKPLAERRWEKSMDDLKKLITPDQIQAFDKCEQARKAISVLGTYMTKNEIPSQSDYCLVRDNLIARLCIENACRAGPLSNMTIGELKNATSDGEAMVVNVMKHKTAVTHGPATIVLSPTVFKWLQAFVTHLRNNLPGVGSSKDDKVFLSWTASEMSSSMISAQLNSFWQKSMGKEQDRICAASFRKAAVSEVHENHENLKSDLADLMGHHQKTAEKYYLIRQKNRSAARTSKALTNIMYRGTSHTATTVNTDKNEITPTDKEEEDITKSPESPRHRWIKEEIVAVKTLFQKNIKDRKIRIDIVRDKMQNHPLLKNLNPAKVMDKIRSLIKLEESEDSNDQQVELPVKTETLLEKIARLDEADNDSVLLISERKSQRAGGTFSELQTRIIWRLFKGLIESNGRVERKDICQCIQEDNNARDALAGFTPQQLCDKIRTERRMIARRKLTKTVPSRGGNSTYL